MRILTNDDRAAVQVALGHASMKMGDPHYRSSEAKGRARESLAQAQEDQHRCTGSGHTVDYRNRPSEPRGAATPGTLCLDPLDSPQPGQVKGRLCTAYGACPNCAFGQPLVDRPVGLARMLQVSAAYAEARSRISAVRWREVIEPLKRKLDDVFIPEFRRASPHLVAAAEAMSLPPIPRFE